MLGGDWREYLFHQLVYNLRVVIGHFFYNETIKDKRANLTIRFLYILYHLFINYGKVKAIKMDPGGST